MSRIATLCFLALIFVGCRKTILPHENGNQLLSADAIAFLHRHMDPVDYAELDLNAVIISEKPTPFIRVGFKNKDIYRDFVLVKADSTGKIEGAKMISLSITDKQNMNGLLTRSDINKIGIEDFDLESGWLKRRSFEGPANSSYVSNIVAEDPHIFPKTTTKLYYSEGGMRPVDYMALEHAWNRPEPSTSSSQYYHLNQPPPTTYGGGAASATKAPPKTIQVDIETGYQRPELDINRVVNCFFSVPDNHAVCSIELLTDIPVDTEPRALFNWEDNTTGHCFIKLSKSAAGRTVTQYLGFHPRSSLKATATTAPIPGKFVDDAKHEYNASIRIEISAAAFDRVLSFIQNKATRGIKYDVDDYNCTNFALEAFNIARPSKPVNPTLVRIPGTMNARGSVAPQAVYLELQRLMKTDVLERPNIVIKNGKAFADPSFMPCR